MQNIWISLYRTGIGLIGPISPVLYRSGPKSVLELDRGPDGSDWTVNIPTYQVQVIVLQKSLPSFFKIACIIII